RISHRFILSPGLEYKWKDLTITPGLRLLQQQVNNKLVTSDVLLKQKQFDVFPAFAVVYKQLSFSYNRDVILPAFQFLNPVSDLSNPYFISKGNPTLLPTKRDNFSVNYYFN